MASHRTQRAPFAHEALSGVYQAQYVKYSDSCGLHGEHKVTAMECASS